MLIHKKIKLFFLEHWVKVTIASVAIILLILAIYGLSSLESFYRQMKQPTFPFQINTVSVHPFIFV